MYRRIGEWIENTSAHVETRFDAFTFLSGCGASVHLRSVALFLRWPPPPSHCRLTADRINETSHHRRFVSFTRRSAVCQRLSVYMYVAIHRHSNRRQQQQLLLRTSCHTRCQKMPGDRHRHLKYLDTSIILPRYFETSIKLIIIILLLLLLLLLLLFFYTLGSIDPGG